MNKHRVKIGQLMPIDVWVTTNVAVFRQSTFWTTIDKVYQFVPAKPKGYVILTGANERMHCRQLQGYVIYRPSSVTISWLSDKTLNFRKLSLIDAMTWHDKNQGRWKVIGNPVLKTNKWGDIPF